MPNDRPEESTDSTKTPAASATATTDITCLCSRIAIRPIEAAKIMHVSRATIVNWCDQGVLPHFKHGKVILISPQALRDLIPTQ